ncbi:site-specific integrase [Staphylococcus epidermidis]|nr:site-specific integrase [Staphylococcus epidermidis]MCG1495914.1 site-specific integrase [Staphylococcus epidermidis]MCG2195324.1 site-specific integrase [Staphylococcus epidermidis]MCG2398237.1 site-specific integrase [Staphylococcus epidermidis]
MWHEKFTNKHGDVQYRYYEKYKDPLTNKWRRVSVVLNKNGKQSQKEAQKRLNERIEAKLNDKTPTTLKALTFHAACDEWFKRYKLTSGSKQSTVTTKSYKIAHIKRNIDKNILAQNMNADVLQNLINSSLTEGLSHKVVKDDLSIIKNIIRYTQKKYNITDISYIDDVIVPKKATTIEEVKAKRENYLEMNEVHLIAEELKHIANNKRASYMKRSYLFTAYIIEFQVLNGMRIGELLAIQPENIDFKSKKLIIDGTIHWRKERNNVGFKDTTKTASSYRTISLTTRSCDILRKVMLENKKAVQWEKMYVDRDFIFTNHRGNPLSLTSINRNIQIAAKNVGIEKHITSHTMRHSHISLLSQLGISLRAIMDRVGHTDHKTTLQIYSHVTEQMDKDMMNKLETINIV